MTTECYYDILEISRTADENEIKKAYRKMALRWHPDKNPDKKEEAEARFKEVSEAYEVLSDKAKRGIYDKYGKEGLVNGVEETTAGSSRHAGGRFTGPTTFCFRDPFDIFREFFGGRDPFQDMFGGSGGLIGGFFTQDPFGFDMFGDMADPFSLGAMGGPSLFAASSQPRIVRRVDARRRTHPYAGQSRQLQVPTRQHTVVSMPLVNAPFFAPPPPFAGISSMTPFGFPAGAGGNFVSTSSSTKIVNGKRIVTKKVVQNGTETVTVEENGRITSKTVNGVPQRVA